MGLRLRLVLIVTLPAVLVVGVHGFFRAREDTEALRAEERRNVSATAAAIRLTLERALRERPVEALAPVVNQIVAREVGVERLRVFDTELFTASSAGRPSASDVPIDVLRRVRDSGRGEQWRAVLAGHRVVVIVVPVRDRRGRVGALAEIAQSTSEVDRRVEIARRDLWIRMTLMVMALASVTWLALHHHVVRPLTQLVGGIERLRRGEPGRPLAIRRRDELGKVAAAFNDMAAYLEHSRLKLTEESKRLVALQQQLQRMHTLAAVGRLASGLAHEVGTPLNIILARAEFVLKGLPPGDARRADVEVIVAQIDRIARILRSLLDTVRPHPPRLAPLALSEMLDSLLPLLRDAARARGVVLEATVPPSLPRVLADLGQLQQVAINLIMNAIEASTHGERVTVTARDAVEPGSIGVVLEVADAGDGIGPNDLARVFEPFFTTKPAGQGTGLGLAIARDIVRAHGGDLTVDSRPGQGTVFRVWLRRAEALAA